MGIPIKRLIETKGRVKTADCVGCGRCVQACPRGALEMVDIRNWVSQLGKPSENPNFGD